MIGHQWAKSLLDNAATRQRLGHSYLFIGPESVGKTSLAMYLAGLLVCETERGRPCGICRGCRGLARGSHPDVTIVGKEPDRRDITIDQVRLLEQGVSMQPYEATHKLVCIAGADMMNDAAASALLKTLEEPPPRAVLALTAADPSSLPVTIRSRCQAMTLQPVPAASIVEALVAEHMVPHETATELASLARGRPGWAVNALQDPTAVERERASLQAIAALEGAGPYSRMVAVEEWLGKGAFVEMRARALEFTARLEAWWRDALLLSVSAGNSGLHRHLLTGVATTGVAASDAVGFLIAVQQAAQRLEANVAPRMVLDHLMSVMPSRQAVSSGR